MGREDRQQLAVVAKYSDGSTEDVTRMTQFDSNDPEMAEVAVTGLVTTGQLTGSVAVMARYQGQVSIFRAVMPLGVASSAFSSLPEPKTYVDELVFKKLIDLGLPASPLADDATFLRRATIDIAGRLPTLAEAEAFLANASSSKRSELVERLINSTDYADY
jgi:hypothetical protein